MPDPWLFYLTNEAKNILNFHEKLDCNLRETFFKEKDKNQSRPSVIPLHSDTMLDLPCCFWTFS